MKIRIINRIYNVYVTLSSSLFAIGVNQVFGKKRKGRKERGRDSNFIRIKKRLLPKKSEPWSTWCPLTAQINRTNLPVNIPDAIKMLILWERGRGLKSLLYFKICGTLSSKDRHQCKINVYTCYTSKDQREAQFYTRYLFFFLQKLDGDIHQEFRGAVDSFHSK